MQENFLLRLSNCLMHFQLIWCHLGNKIPADFAPLFKRAVKPVQSVESGGQETLLETSLKLGISACLMGQKVRYDGRHKLEPFLKNTMGQYVEYVAVCPEVECGLPVPREPLCLVGDSEAPRLVTIQNNRDYTPRMKKWARIRLNDLKKRGVSGFIFKSNSPSCGLHGVRVQNEKGGPAEPRGPAGKARGIFAG